MAESKNNRDKKKSHQRKPYSNRTVLFVVVLPIIAIILLFQVFTSKIFEEIGLPAECLATANIIQNRKFDLNDRIIDTRLRDFGKKSQETDDSLRNLYMKSSSVLTKIEDSKSWFQYTKISKTKIEEFRRNVQYFGERLNHFITNIEELMEDLRLVNKSPEDFGKDLLNLHTTALQMKIILNFYGKSFANDFINDDKFVGLIKDFYYEFNKKVNPIQKAFIRNLADTINNGLGEINNLDISTEDAITEHTAGIS
ncbi:3590_t:CDS:2 [Funneliformis geosporum]|uniref:3590_t:CDS:1 n=1 Tax=Funneliformis geosporum TaxID=1117311 RepID=A0A9W4SBE1_9GLOM|nr:3590_t:CDS:2 [Funneliformis geosporum]